jgi:hypothetical protein
MTREERFADYPRDADGNVLDFETGDPLTDWEMDVIMASEDPATVRAFKALLEEADRWMAEPDVVIGP